MREENNEVVEEKVEEVIETKEVEEVPKKKKSSSGVIIPIIAALVAFAVVYGGITLVTNLGKDNDVVEKGNEKVEDKQEVENENSEDVVEEDNTAASGSTVPEVPITITEDMKKELNKIANIGDGYCYVQKLFYSMNGKTSDLTYENKKYIVMNYFVLTNPGSDRINEATYKSIAQKYSFNDAFDIVFAGFEKVGDEYVIPPMGCVGPEYVVNNPTYVDSGNTITVTDNVEIRNSENSDVTKIKVIYTFVYSTDSNNNITFRLEQVNSVK